MNKVQKIREEVARIQLYTQSEVLKQILDFIDSLQEEPVSKDFEMALAEMVAKAQKCVVEPWVVAAQWKDELIRLAKGEEPVSDELDLVAMQRMEECPFREVGCTMYEDKILECNGACSWVVDYPKLKELKAQKGKVV